MALHEQSVGATDEWYTPRYIFDAMQTQFDLDPAHPGLDVVDWVPADRVLTQAQDGLSADWTRDGGRPASVWLNPPFGKRNGIVPWLSRFFNHYNGVVLVPDRTSAPWWQHYAAKAELLLFVSPKIKFIDQHGNPGQSPAQGTVLMGCGWSGMTALLNARDHGLGILMTPGHHV